MSHPVETLITRTGIVATAGNNLLQAAPGANKRIVVAALTMQNESQTATTMIMRSASTTNGHRILGQNQGDGLSREFPVDREWRLNWNEALNLWLSGANQCGYTIEFFIEGRNA